MNIKITSLLLISFLMLSACSGFFKKTDAREIPTSGPERAKKNIAEGRGVSLKGATNAMRGGGAFEFSSANPLWRATLEILDFLPLSNVDYSGGVIITDWYSDNLSQNDSLKITVRFFSNEVRANNIKIIVHEKKCNPSNICQIKEINSKIKEDLLAQILKSAAILEKNTNSKK